MNFLMAIMMLIAPSSPSGLGEKAIAAEAEVNYDDPNLAQPSGFATEASSVCAQRGSESAQAMEACLSNYGMFSSGDLSSAVMVVKSETSNNSGTHASRTPRAKVKADNR